MKKIITNSILLVLSLLIILIFILSSVGIETKKFNNLISNKASQTQNINLKLDTIKFKVDPKKLNLFLETKNPTINYRDVLIPVKNIKVYIDFLSVIKSDPIIKKINFVLDELDISQLNKLSIIIKPSNFKSLLNNKIKEGSMISEIDIFLNEQGSLKDFIAKGSVRNLKAELYENLNLKKTNLSFFADRKDILIKNINGELEDIKIAEGDIKLNFENGIKFNSNFNSKLDLNEKILKKYFKLFDKNKVAKGLKNLKADLNNNIYIDFDNTYKVKDYNYNISGNLEKSRYSLSQPFKNIFLKEKIKEINLIDMQIKTTFSPKKMKFKSKGKYSFNNSDFLKINIENNINNELINLKLDADYSGNLEIGLINYKKTKGAISNLLTDITLKKDEIEIKNLNFKEKNNSFLIKGLRFKKENFVSFQEIKVETSNNDFLIKSGKKIFIKGSKFDANNLGKFLSKQNGKNKLRNLNSDIEVDFKSISVPMSEKLRNFKLIGEINKGQFIKISSKGDFGGNNFLDISMKKDKNSNKKYLEIYSDLPRPLLTEYSFFKGLSGGKLFFTSIIDKSNSYSKIKIEDFKVINAPGVIKLLSLADLGGLADLAEGEGLSFDLLEIDMEKNKNFLKINEILALGPSMSVLMEGYQDEKGLTSLRGTLVPAKTLNKMISKIPVIGNIVIPKEVGEGLFGISFKMKGIKGQIKTTINPIRTLTPRFIQKIIDKRQAK